MFKASLVTAFLAIVAFSPAFAAQDGDQGEGAGGREHGRAPHNGAGGKWQGRGPDGRDWQAGRGDNNQNNWQGGKPNRNWHEGRGDNHEGDWEGGHHYYSHRGYYGGYGAPYGYYRRPYAYSYSYGGYGGCGWLYANAMGSGDPYWWEQYYACMGY
jgi:hypothetical protein